MKKHARLISLTLVSALLLISLSGCFGNFALTRKAYQFNESVGDKWVQQIVFWLMNFVPVYNAAATLDLVLFNTIEFWTGSNPIAMNATDEVIKYANTENGNFEIKITQNRIFINQLTGQNAGTAMEMNFNPETNSWYLSSNGKTQKIATMNDDNLNLIYPSGKELAIHLAR